MEKRIYLLAQLDDTANLKLRNIYSELTRAGFHGTQTPDVPYHFTLRDFDLNEKPRILERVREICSIKRVFNIHMSHIGLFGLDVLFIAPSMNQELLNLHNAFVPEKLADGLSNWVAHATVLMDDPDNIKAAIPVVSKAFVPFTAKVVSIGVYEFSPIKLIAEYKLKTDG